MLRWSGGIVAWAPTVRSLSVPSWRVAPCQASSSGSVGQGHVGGRVPTEGH